MPAPFLLSSLLGRACVLALACGPLWSAETPAPETPNTAEAASASRLIVVTDYGCRGDGSFDNGPALVALTTRCGAANFIFPPGKYLSSATIPLASGATIQGYGATLQCTADAPALASVGWLDDSSPTGNTTISGLTIRGDVALRNQVGLILRDYYSLLEHVTITSCGGPGIMLTTGSKSGKTVGGTLVENRIINCSVRNTVGTCLLIGEPNNKLTDGIIDHCILFQHKDATVPALVINSAAGWSVSGLHVYGPTQDVPVVLNNAWSTTLRDLYIETYRTHALSLVMNGNSTVVSDVIVNKCTAADPEQAAVIGVNGKGGLAVRAVRLGDRGPTGRQLVESATGSTVVVDVGSN